MTLTRAMLRLSSPGRGPMRQTECSILIDSPRDRARSYQAHHSLKVGASARRRAPLLPVECGPSDTSKKERERGKEKERDPKPRCPSASGGGIGPQWTIPWLILRVVICLSQILIRAHLSTSHIKVKPRMAY
jgi:hypothetical protein